MTIDVAIIGAGFTGLNLAYSLAASKLDVVIFERKDSYPDAFRAEKIETDQAKIMRELGTLDYRVPKMPPLGIIQNLENGKLTQIDTVEQYGISYNQTVNNLRKHLPENIKVIDKAVVNISDSGKLRNLQLSDNSILEAKIVILCTGGNVKMLNTLGINRMIEANLVSLSFGFDLEIENSSVVPFNGFNYHINNNEHKINYLTLFPIGNRMRVNLFTQLRTKDRLTSELKNNTIETIQKCFPRLTEYTGQIKLASKVQIMPTQFYRLQNHIRPGFIVMADEYQGVNPVTGTGLSKVLTDVKVLSQKYIPEWIKNNRFEKIDMKAFYKDNDKVHSDRNSLYSWIHYYQEVSLKKMPLIQKFKLKHMIF